MSRYEKLNRAFQILQKDLRKLIHHITLDDELVRIKIELTDGSTIYIMYNDHSEYGYNLIFSSIKYDRVRFDNFDDTWQVSSQPHHFHPRYAKEGFTSLMTGNPEEDIALFTKLIKSRSLTDPEFRF
jgi:hypothetical protein